MFGRLAMGFANVRAGTRVLMPVLVLVLVQAFEVADVMEREFEADSFDVIYSRDAILHVEDKPALFARLLRWLKPGGRLLLTDYCCGEEKELSRDFIDNGPSAATTTILGCCQAPSQPRMGPPAC